MQQSTAIHRIAKVAATALVLSSCGFAAIFAWRIGIEHSLALAIITVVFAVSLDALKPTAIHSAFVAFANWQAVRGLCLALLGLVAVCFSLTSELALTATSRSDLASSRGANEKSSAAKETQYKAALKELDTLKASRQIEEINADIAKLEIQYPSLDCDATKYKWHCTKIENYKAEKARSERKQKLENIASAYTANDSSNISTVADPLSAAIATYLTLLGIIAELSTIAQWLNLVPVVALELGSALAMVLVSALAPQKEQLAVQQQASNGSFPFSQTPNGSFLAPIEPLQVKDQVALQLLQFLLARNGSHFATERELSTELGASRATMKRSLSHLAAQGLIEYKPSKRGTALTVVKK